MRTHKVAGAVLKHVRRCVHARTGAHLCRTAGQNSREKHHGNDKRIIGKTSNAILSFSLCQLPSNQRGYIPPFEKSPEQMHTNSLLNILEPCSSTSSQTISNQ